MNFKGIIQDLLIEIQKINIKKSKEIDFIEKKWITFSAPRFKQEKERRDLERKLERAGLEDMVEIKKKINKLDEILPKYEPYRVVKEQKLEAAKDNAKIEIGNAILVHIEKIQEAIKKEQDNFASYAENIISSIEPNNSDLALDLKNLRKRFEDLKFLSNSLDELKKYNGRIETPEVCNNLMQGLEKEDADVVYELFKIITRNTIDMRKVEIVKEVSEETFEINEDADISKMSNSNLNLKEQDFLEELKNKPLEEIFRNDMKKLIRLHDQVEFNEIEEIVFDGLVMSYNIYIENDYKNSISEENLETYDKNDIMTELFRKPKKILFSSKFAEYIGQKLIDSFENKMSDVENALEEDRLEESINNINAGLKEKYLIKGVTLFIAKNKLAEIKLKLYQNDNLFEDEKECERYERLVNFISTTLSKKLSKLTKTEYAKSDNDCIMILLDQYLELLSIGDFEKAYNDLIKYLDVVSNQISESVYRAYKAAAKMIIEYRKTNKYTPYEMKYVNIEYGEFYNEIDDIIKFYDEEAKEFNNIENAIYLKRR